MSSTCSLKHWTNFDSIMGLPEKWKGNMNVKFQSIVVEPFLLKLKMSA